MSIVVLYALRLSLMIQFCGPVRTVSMQIIRGAGTFYLYIRQKVYIGAF